MIAQSEIISWLTQPITKHLACPNTASVDDIKRAYPKMTRKDHPDVNPDAGVDAKFKAVGPPMKHLATLKSGAAYDRYGADLDKPRQDPVQDTRR